MSGDKPVPPPDTLIGICQGVMADGRVVADEALFLHGWLQNSTAHHDIPAVRRLHSRVQTMLADGAFTTAEARQLAGMLRSLVLDAGHALPQDVTPPMSPAKRWQPSHQVQPEELRLVSPDLPVFDRPDILDFSAAFCFTGIFAFGERDDCEQATISLGGGIKKRPVGSTPCYVVVGSIASPFWAYGDYGTKIEQAMQYREMGKPVQIIHEDTWAERLTPPRGDAGATGHSLRRPRAAQCRDVALDTLKSLTQAWTDKPARRQQQLLWDFDQGEAAGWAFRVGPWYRTALDILYTPRSVERRISYEWTQGSAFNFCQGYTTTSCGPGLDIGGRCVPATLQVLEARPASLATVTVHRWVLKPDEGEIIRLVAEAEDRGCRHEWRHEQGHKQPYSLSVLQRRSIGVAHVQVHLRTDSGWPVFGRLVVSQDDLVEILIRGFDDAQLAALVESRQV